MTVLLLLCVPALGAEARKPLTLAQCLDAALLKNPLVRAARFDVDVFEKKLAQARAAAMPSFVVNGQTSIIPALDANNGKDTIITWSRPGLAGRIEGSGVLPLYTFGKLDALRTLAERGVDVSRALEAMARAEIAWQVTRAYWAWVLSLELSEMAEQGQDKLKSVRDKLQGDMDTNPEYDPTDLLKVKVYAADLELKVREIARLRAMAESGLAMLMGEPERRDFEPKDAVMSPTPVNVEALDAYKRLARLNRPQLVALRGGVEVRLAERDLARANRWPDFFFAGGWTYANAMNVDAPSGPLTTNGLQYNYGGAFLGMRWSLDLGRWHRADEIDAEARKIEAQEEAAVRAVDLEVENLWRELRDTRAMLGTYETSMKAARSWLVAENDLYESGLQEMRDIIIPLEQYFRRRIAFLEAQFNHNVAVASLSRAIGVDVTRLGAAPPKAP